jgi:hypothetical protein
MHQRLQHRLQMPRRQAVTLGQRFGCDRCPARMNCDIDHGRDRQQTFFRQ